MSDAESDAPLAHTGPDAPVAHTEQDVPLAHIELNAPLPYFSSAPNSPLKVDPDPRQATSSFLFTITHLFICLDSYYCHHCDRVFN